MLNSLEKEVMLLLYERAANKESVLINPNQIIIALLPKYEITFKELDKIINNLVIDGYIDLIYSDNKGATIYCISLKVKGIAFKRDIEMKKKYDRQQIIRTIIFAALGALAAIVVRAIFT